VSQVLAALSPWLATLRDTAIAIAAICGALVTIAAAAKLPFINKPIHWLWREMVSDPMRNWLGGVIEEHFTPDRDRLTAMEAKLAIVEHEVRTNDGQSLRDVADRVELMAQTLIDRTEPS
jgi:transcriptional regulator GlxA family with amidase domain